MIGRFWVAGLAGALCAAPALAAPDTAQDIRQWHAQQQRVLTLANRILVANAVTCKDVRPDYGYLPANMSPAAPAPLRAVWQEALGLDERPMAIIVLKDGPADKAGLRQGDHIMAVAGTAWGSDKEQRQAFDTAMSTALPSGTLDLDIEHGGQTRAITLSGRPACKVDVVVVRRASANASTFGNRVEVDGGLERLLADDDELAFVLGHEIAHAVLEHSGPGKEADTRNHDRRAVIEREADVLGVRLMTRAGFDPAAAARANPKLAHANRGPISRLLDLHGAYMATNERTAFLASEGAKAKAEITPR